MRYVKKGKIRTTCRLPANLQKFEWMETATATLSFWLDAIEDLALLVAIASAVVGWKCLGVLLARG